MSAHLDEQQISDLRELMGDDFVSLVEAFLRDSGDRLQQLKQSFGAGDLETVKRQAHSLKGSSSNLGALQLASHCQQLEMHVQGGANASLADEYHALCRELAAVQHELRERFR